MIQAMPASTLDTLSRLASKTGVQSTLILSKADGSIIRTSGLLADSSPSVPQAVIADSATNQHGLEISGDARGSRTNFTKNVGLDTKSVSAEDVARMVFAFVGAANAFAGGMDASEEAKLLRMRTRKNEIVIVPDAKFILVVIHNASTA